MYINAHQSWWCNMMCIIFYIMMYGDSESWYIMMCDVHHMWCAVMHIMVKYDSEWCESMYIICDVHHTHIWCVMMYNDVTSFFFILFSWARQFLHHSFQRHFGKGYDVSQPFILSSLEHFFFYHLNTCDFHAQLITWHLLITWKVETCARK